MDRKKLTAEIIYKLTLSNIPPSFQEFIINNLHKAEPKKLEQIIKILDDLSKKQIDYIKAREEFKKIYKDLDIITKDKMIEKADQIRKELDDEIENDKD